MWACSKKANALSFVTTFRAQVHIYTPKTETNIIYNSNKFGKKKKIKSVSFTKDCRKSTEVQMSVRQGGQIVC